MKAAWLVAGLFVAAAGLGMAVGSPIGADPRDQLTPDQALRAAVVAGDEQRTEAALDAGADADASVDGTTVLHVAARRGDPRLVRLLLARGADAHALTARGETALDLALARRHGQAAALLRQATTRRPADLPG